MAVVVEQDAVVLCDAAHAVAQLLHLVHCRVQADAVLGFRLPALVLILKTLADALQRFGCGELVGVNPALQARARRRFDYVRWVHTDVEADAQGNGCSFHAIFCLPRTQTFGFLGGAVRVYELVGVGGTTE